MSLIFFFPDYSDPKSYHALLLISQDHSTQNCNFYDIHTFPILTKLTSFNRSSKFMVWLDTTHKWKDTLFLARNMLNIYVHSSCKINQVFIFSKLLSIMMIPSQLRLLSKFYSHFATGITSLSNNLGHHY